MSLAKYLLVTLSMLMFLIQPASAETISIGGSTTVQKYIELAAEAYSSTHPGISFNINGGGSTAGYALIVDRRLHVGMMSRELSEQEKQALGDTRVIAFALDAIVPIVSREIYESGIHQISPENLAAIYRGHITNWKNIGGPDRRIFVVDKNTYHGTRHVFSDYVLGSVSEPSASVVLDSDDDVVRLVKSSDQAIGYVGIGYIAPTIRTLSLEINGKAISASTANIRSGAHPLSRKLYLLVPKAAPDYVQTFVQFILSREGQMLVHKAGYIPMATQSSP